MTTYNLNSTCTVKLNRFGIKVWNKHYTCLKLDPSDYKFNFIDKKRTVLEGPLWEIMNIFGSVLIMGNESPFVDNEINIHKEGC